MAKIEVLNFGSLNIDHVYRVDHFVRPGETLSCESYSVFAGGKGLNQSVALARAGVRVAHAGKIGNDGDFLRRTLQESGVDVSLLLRGEVATGHACIQVDKKGQNSILLYPGANRDLSKKEIVTVLDQLERGSILLLQNEINHIPFLMEEGHKRGLYVAINPAPCGPEVSDYPLELVDLLFVNEIEGAQLSGCDGDAGTVCDELAGRFPEQEIVMTLGGDGALYAHGEQRIRVEAPPVDVVDTTSAGDTFTGYFIAAKLRGFSAAECMRTASLAGSIAVSRPGAASSIPAAAEVFG